MKIDELRRMTRLGQKLQILKSENELEHVRNSQVPSE